MQFYLIVEFLIPGFATTLLAICLLEQSSFNLLMNIPKQSETLIVLVLLTIAYPIGILTNFLIYMLLQHWLLRPCARKKVLNKWYKVGVDVTKLVQRLLIRSGEIVSSVDDKLKIEKLFEIIYSFVFSHNIDRLNSNYLYHEGLQRLSRGIIPSLLLAIALVLKKHPSYYEFWLVFLFILFIIAIWLLKYSVDHNEEFIVRFFVTLMQSSIVSEVKKQTSFLSSLTPERKRKHKK